LDCFAAFPDRRARRSIVIFFFCHTLVHLGANGPPFKQPTVGLYRSI
jgi:hypothetical protein